jgi:hypothetical protein
MQANETKKSLLFNFSKEVAIESQIKFLGLIDSNG